ncbi:hypothetical protein [Streptomyces sp. NPDC015125]|uniref:hypothetical protein n=1 Tax=Streptomyces sp. NPDC015125 TaxID=3364938 RepID=UPI0036F7B567
MGRGLLHAPQLRVRGRHVAGGQQRAGGVGCRTGPALRRRQHGEDQAHRVREGPVDVAELAMDTDPVQQTLRRRQLPTHRAPATGVCEACRGLLGQGRELTRRRRYSPAVNSARPAAKSPSSSRPGPSASAGTVPPDPTPSCAPPATTAPSPAPNTVPGPRAAVAILR